MTIATGQNIDASDFVGNPAPFLSIESTSGATHSLTTVANQKVLVFAKGDYTGSSSDINVVLAYNGVNKDVVTIDPDVSGANTPFCLMYQEIPGAGTQNVTVSVSSGSLNNVVIMVIKLLVG